MTHVIIVCAADQALGSNVVITHATTHTHRTCTIHSQIHIYTHAYALANTDTHQ